MYCPRCGRRPISNELRFCSYCGFKLGVVKASLAEEEEANPVTTAKAQPVSEPPRHRNINIGVILMFLGSTLAIYSGLRGGIGREGGVLVLTSFYAAILLFSPHILKAIYRLLSLGEPPPDRLSTSRRETGFGATLMFLGTALSAIISFLIAGRVKSSTLPIAVLVTFAVLLLISPQLLRALRYLIRDEARVPTKVIEGSAVSERVLPAAQELVSLDAPRVNTAEMRLPVASVTEHTTGLLIEK